MIGPSVGPTKPQVAKSGKATVRTTGLPMSLSVPPALESGAEDMRPAMKRRMIRAVMLGARAEASSNRVAMIIVTT